ncbi:MAG TPA: oligosaccharide flippase family protein, partial [Nitrospirota bacterium]|nr:oligosaccharide flippase family protein [Nitrospirota bacterium]
SSLAVAGIAIAVVSEFFLSLSMLSRAVFQAFEKMIYDPVVSIIYCLLLSAGITVAIVLDWGLLGLLGAAAIANAAQFLISARIFSSRFVRPSFDFDKSVLRTYLKDAAVIGIGIFFYQNLFRINVLMLKWLGKIEDVAYFQIAHNFIMQLQVLPFAFVTAVFPVFSRLLSEEPARMRDAYQRIFRYILILSFFVSLFIFGFSREIVETVFGSKYDRSAAALMIVSWAVAPLALDMLMNSMLIAMDKQRYAVIYAGVTLLLNLIFAVLLIPSHGFIAASWLSLSSYVLLLMFSLYFVSRNGLGGVSSCVLLKTLLAGLIGLAAIYFLKSVSAVFAFMAASGLYFGALYRMHVFGTDDITLLRGLYSRSQSKEDS